MGLESIGSRSGGGAHDRDLAARTMPTMRGNEAINMADAPDIARILSQNNGSDQEPFREVVRQIVRNRLNGSLNATGVREEHPDLTDEDRRLNETASKNTANQLFGKLLSAQEMTVDERDIMREARAAFHSRSESARIAQENINTDNVQRLVEISGRPGGNPFLAEIVSQVGIARSIPLIRDALRRNAITNPQGFASIAQSLQQAQNLREGRQYTRLNQRIEEQVERINATLDPDQQIDRARLENILSNNALGSGRTDNLFGATSLIRRELGISWVNALWQVNNFKSLRSKLVNSRDIRGIDRNITAAARTLVPTLQRQDPQLRRILAQDLQRAMNGEAPLPVERTRPESIAARIRNTETSVAAPSTDRIVTEWNSFIEDVGRDMNPTDRRDRWEEIRRQHESQESAQWGTGVIASIMRVLFGYRWDEADRRVRSTFLPTTTP